MQVEELQRTYLVCHLDSTNNVTLEALAEAHQKAAEATTAAAQAAAQVAVNRNTNVIDFALLNQQAALVPKPLGSAGDGYCLIEKMGLVNNKKIGRAHV